MHPKKLAFVKEIEPVVLDLASKWFPPDQKTPDGQYYYACTYCDQGCGKHDAHDPDCLYELAKATKEQWDKIDNELDKYKRNYAGELRSIEEIFEIKDGLKYDAFFKYFFVLPSRLVAWDYSTAGEENQNVVCGCWMLQVGTKKLRKKNKHYKYCVHVKISKAISRLYSVEE